jgi:hypothetical protein
MGKYDHIPLKKIKARTENQCSKCEKVIQVGEHYYSQRDRHLQSLHSPKFCSECYQKHGAKLLEKQKIRTRDNKTGKLDNYFNTFVNSKVNNHIVYLF